MRILVVNCLAVHTIIHKAWAEISTYYIITTNFRTQIQEEKTKQSMNKNKKELE